MVQTAFIESKVAAAMTATITASTISVYEGVETAFLAFENAGATASLTVFAIFAALLILAGHFWVNIKTSAITTEKLQQQHHLQKQQHL